MEKNVNSLKINYFTPKFTPEGKMYGFMVLRRSVNEKTRSKSFQSFFFKRKLNINSDEIAEIEVQRVHRVWKQKTEPNVDGSPRPIRFLRFRDREFTLSKSKLLKGTTFRFPWTICVCWCLVFIAYVCFFVSYASIRFDDSKQFSLAAVFIM